MKIIIGTKNEGKLRAVSTALRNYSFFDNYSIDGTDVSSGVNAQPIGFDEIYSGARNRAVNAFSKVESPRYSIGIEGGIVVMPNNMFHNVTACVFYDGSAVYPGFSSLFPLPRTLSELVLSESIELDKAAYRLGITSSERVGAVSESLSDGMVNRSIFIGEAVRNAVIPILKNNRYNVK